MLACAVAAVGAGCALLVALSAPPRMILVNGAALVVGIAGVILIAMCRRAGMSRRVSDIALLGTAALVPLTAFAGPPASGVARWLVIGGLTVQPALIVVPVIALGMALHPSAIRAAAAVVVAIGLAIQPDPGHANNGPCCAPVGA
jgi:cell division protein FtsW (lipid II flippase)